MKQADPHLISSGTASRIGPCPSISPERNPWFNPQWCNSFVKDHNFLLSNKQPNQLGWQRHGMDTQWHQSQVTLTLLKPTLHLLTTIKDECIILGKSILNPQKSLSGLLPPGITFSVSYYNSTQRNMYRMNKNPKLLSYLCLQLKIQLMFYPYYSQGKLWSKI